LKNRTSAWPTVLVAQPCHFFLFDTNPFGSIIVPEAEVLLVESTYGNRTHPDGDANRHHRKGRNQDRATALHCSTADCFKGGGSGPILGRRPPPS
jgi:hypothetical protein